MRGLRLRRAASASALESARAEIEGVAADATREMVQRVAGLTVEASDAASAVKAEFNV